MYIFTLRYDAPSRMLSDNLSGKERIIGTKGDNEIVKIRFDINDPQGELDGLDAGAEFDISVKGEHGQVYKPHLALDGNNEVTLPNDVMNSARKFSLPIQLVFEGEDGTRICSFNMLTYTVMKSVRAIY